MNPIISNTFSLSAMKHGSDGNPGGNTATLFLYKRSSTPITAIDWNYALTYNFTTQLLSSIPAGWSLNQIPNGTDPVYVTAATAYSITNTDTIAADEWSTPVEFVENGVNTATVFLFKRSATPLTAHGITSDAVYYKFSDGKLYNGTGSNASVITDLNGWKRNIPDDDGNPCYVTQATALGIQAFDQILHGEWGDVTKLVEDSAILDIDNEMDMVQTDSTGKVSAARNIITRARLFKGSTLQTNPDLPTAASLAISYKDASGNTQSLQPTITNSSGVIEIKWAFTTAMTLTGTMYEKTITIGGKSAIFTLCASHGQPIYQLKPSHSSLPCTRSADHSLSAPPALSLKVLKIDGKSTDEKDATNANLTTFGVTVRYSTSSMPSSKTAGTAWPNDNSVQAANTNTNVYIAMFNSDGTLLDRETIPIVKDGGNGYGIALTLTRNNLYTEANWNTYAEIGHSESYSKRTGDSDLTTCRVGDYFMVTGKASDSNLNHTAIYKCTAVSASSITGTCISHTHDGESAIYADIDNEMDGVACNKDGVTTSAQSVSGYASIWKGSSKQTITALSCKINGNTLGTSYNTEGYRFSYNTSTGYCEVGVNTGITIATKVEAIITVSATIDGASVSRDLTLTINGVRAGANGQPATIYNLLPSPSDVNVGKTDAGEYSPRYNTLKCGYKKSVGSEITSVDEVTGTIDSAYRVFFRRHTRNGDWDTYYYHYPHATYNRYLVITSGYSTSGLDAATYDKVEFILYKDTSSTSLVASSIDTTKIIDRETVPVVADGQKGGNGDSGNGINTVTYYRCFTQNFSAPEDYTSSEWKVEGSSDFPSEEGLSKTNRFLWQLKKTTYTKTSDVDYEVSLLAQFQSGVCENLLEDTAFLSEGQMEAWENKGGTIGKNLIGSHNGYGINTDLLVNYKELLSQKVYRYGSLQKLKPNEWYTLSFYAAMAAYDTLHSGTTYNGKTDTDYAYINEANKKFYVLNGNTARVKVTGYNASSSVYMRVFLFARNQSGTGWEISTSQTISGTSSQTVTLELANTLGRSVGYAQFEIEVVVYTSSGSQNTNSGSSYRGYVSSITLDRGCRFDTFLHRSDNGQAVLHSSSAPWYVDGKKVTSAGVVADNDPSDVMRNGTVASFGDDGCVHWQLNPGYKRHTITFKTPSSLASGVDYYVRFRYTAESNYFWISIPKLEENTMATEWIENTNDRMADDIQHVFVGKWVSGTTYYYGGGTGVRHVVRAKESVGGAMAYWRMKQRTTSAGYESTTEPFQDTTHWEKANFLKFVAAEFMLVDEAIINFAQTNRILVYNSSGNVAAGMGGAEGGDNDYPLWVGANYAQRGNAPFRVTLTGKLYATEANIRGRIEGSVRNPFKLVYDSFSTYDLDNLAMMTESDGWGYTTSFFLPWDVNQSGRVIRLSSYAWDSKNFPTSGWGVITAPTGKYFYENGRRFSNLYFSREMIELVGYGTTTQFYGWVVAKRVDFMTDKAYGMENRCIMMGRINGRTESNGTTVKGKGYRFDGNAYDSTTITLTRSGEGLYKLAIPTSWKLTTDSIQVQLTPIGYIKDSDSGKLLNAVVLSFDTSGGYVSAINIFVSDDNSGNDGDVFFAIYNMEQYLQWMAT